MTAHEVDDIGLPVDPTLRYLERQLSILAAQWRGNWEKPAKQDQIMHEYHDIMHQLWSKGWDSELDIDSELPDRLMPQEYLEKHPKVFLDDDQE